jgi:hypothetical protein
MLADHPTITATNSLSEPDRLERLSRVYGYVMALADGSASERFIDKVTQIHDHKDTLIVFWSDPPSDAERQYFASAWASKIGDGSSNVEHEV